MCPYVEISGGGGAWSRGGIRYVVDRLDMTDLQLVELVYFKGTHTVEGAAIIVGLSRTAAFNHINKVLTAVALELGLINVG